MPSRIKKSVRKKTTTVKKGPLELGTKVETTAVKLGRPTKYLPEMAIKAFELMQQGFSKEAVAGALGICKDTLYRWLKEHPDFSDAVSKGNQAAQFYFEKISLDHLTHTKNGTQLNAHVWALHMKNRFGWSEKKDITHEVGEETKRTLSFTLEDKPKNRIE